MLNREIPFRPRLEGDFRIRFYNAVSRITENTTLADIENIADEEIKWVTSECTFNLDQRKKYRAVWFLFRDLIHASWKALYRDGVLYMNLPILNGNSTHDGSAPEVKQLLRSWMSESRHERLLTFIDFIKHMEARNSAGHDISELIADGPELANRIEQAHAGRISIKQAVQPYLQLVTENERDQFTGLKISEIWRYFRLTWSTPSETTPGRTMQYLIRDAAHPMHAVMGIASLENCAVQITCRDDYIGWNQHAFIENILTLSGDDARLEFQRLLGYIEDGISGIDYSELCTEMTVRNPTDEDIRMLLDFAANAEQQRQDSLRNSSENGYDDDERSELGSISTKTEQALYNRKRAEQLARLLIAKKTLTDIVNDPDYDENWINFCKSETGSSVIRNALVAQKTKHIGSSLMELNVCGAIPPYNEILGGKLVALLATSPQVVHDYKTRYENKASEIASRLKGQPVCRPAELVYVGTTSLYYVGSSQYNRLKIPGEVFGSDFDVVWKRLGMTIGFGTMHISKATTLSLTEATSDGFNRINHVFGEGASPKMRLLTMAIRELIEATNEDSKDFSKHAMSRIVYGACLASNTSDYLLGKDDRPHYYTDMEQYEAGTQKIIDYWSERWLSSRLNYEPIYERIRAFDKNAFMVGNQIDGEKEWSFPQLEVAQMVNVWASSHSRIIAQYITLLRGYNLYPKESTLIDLLKQFGHIASNGLISIPRFGSDTQAIENKKKGLIGTLFAASWYTRQHKDSLVASLDDDKARLWLSNSRYGNERADLVGLYYEEEKNALHIQPIEVKTRDDSFDSTITKEDGNSSFAITGHAANQVASIVEMLKEIFSADEDTTDMFTSARREVLKYQIVSECFRNVHDAQWQKKWYDILKKAFGNGKSGNIQIDISGIILHIKLNEATGGEHIICHNPEFEDVRIDFWKLTSHEIQRDVLGDDVVMKTSVTIDFDESEELIATSHEDEDMKRAGEVIDGLIVTADDATSKTMSEKVSTVGEPLSQPEAEFGKAPVTISEPKSVPKQIPVSVSSEEIEQLVKDFKRSCNDYHVNLKECNADDAVVGPSVIRIKFKLARGQALQGLTSHLEDIGREMKRSGVIVQPVLNSDELLLDVPRLQREKVLFSDVIKNLPPVTSPEQLFFPLGRTPNGRDLIEDLGQMPHMLVGGSTGSGKSVFLFTMLAALLMAHPHKEDLQLVLSSSKLEDFIHFEGLPHLYSGAIISDATEATNVIKNVIFEESERRGRLLAEARVANIIEYNKKAEKKLEPIVVVIDEFADLADQLETKKEKDAFFKPVQRIAQAGRSRGIHLVICTQRPEAKLVPPTTKAQLNGRVALRVNDGISSRMIIGTPDAQYLQKHGDMIYSNSDTLERAQGYLIEIPELDEIVQRVKDQNK